MSVKKGDRVSYKVGRGRGEGTVEKVDGDFAAIRTAKGKIVQRQVSQLVATGTK